MLTIMIPTMNRPDFLFRLLRYYRALEFKHWIYIADSSNSDCREKTKKEIKKFDPKLKIKYFELPRIGISECLRKMTESATTPYSALIADDDFLIPNGLEKCIRFLDKNADYSAAHGAGLIFTIDRSGPQGVVKCVGEYAQSVRSEESASSRLLAHLSQYGVTLFSVHRTAVWTNMWKYGEQVKDTSFSAEILPCCLSVVHGKIAGLNCLTLMRQGHDRRYLLPDFYDWITGPTWFQSWENAKAIMIRELTRKAGIVADEAESVVKQAIWAYLKNGLFQKYQITYDPEPKKNFGAAEKILKKVKKTFSLNSSGRFSRHREEVSVVYECIEGKEPFSCI